MEIAVSGSSSSSVSSSSSSHIQQSLQQSQRSQQNRASPHSAHSLLGPLEPTEPPFLPRVNEVDSLHRDPLERVGATQRATKSFRVRRSHTAPLSHPATATKKFRAGDPNRSAGQATSSPTSQHPMLQHTNLQF